MPSLINGRQNKVYLDPFLRYDKYFNHSKTIKSCSYFVFASNQHKYLTTESRGVPIGNDCNAVATRIGAFTHPPQMGIKISTQFIIAHLRLTFLCHPLPCLPHLLLDLLLTLIVTVVAAIVAIQPTVMIAASVVFPPLCNIVLVIKLLIVECK
jgi:hypothetical protein